MYAFTYGSLGMSSFERLCPSFDFTVKQKDSEGRKKSQKKRKKSRAEEETDLKVEGNWKHGTFSTELVVMPLLAGAYPWSQQVLVVLSCVARMSINRMLALTKPLFCHLASRSQSLQQKCRQASLLYRGGGGGTGRSDV